jgi:hypothetical protein
MRRRYFRPVTSNGELDQEVVLLALELGAKVDEDRNELFINEDQDPLEFLSVFSDGIVPPLEHESILKRDGNVIWLRVNTQNKPLENGLTLSAAKIYFHCPEIEEIECLSKGAQWDRRKKQWYIPEGAEMRPFWRWLLN